MKLSGHLINFAKLLRIRKWKDLIEGFLMGLSRPHFIFIFPFSWYIVRLQLIIFEMVNDDGKQERRRKSIHRSMTHY